jgi:hypothetical protein
MTKVPTTLTRRRIFRAGAALAVAATATPLLTRASAEDARQAGAESLNGNGFYRFKIGDFQATVISDGFGQIPIRPIFVTNASEAELAAVLKSNFMQPVIQGTGHALVVHTGRERVLVDNGFGEKFGPAFGSYPRLEANLRRAGITPESIDLVVTSHGHLDHIGGLVTNRARWRFRRLSSSLSTPSGTIGPAAVTKARSRVRRCPSRSSRASSWQLERTCHRSPTDPGS